MTLTYLLGTLFLGWLFAVFYRVMLQFRAARGADGGTGGYARHAGEPKRLAVLMRDQGNWAEWIVRGRIVAAMRREPELRVVLVDGCSADETSLVLERMARQFNMGFCRMDDLGNRCARAAENKKPYAGELVGGDVIECPGPCFDVAADTFTGIGDQGVGRLVRCLKPCGEPGARRCDLGS